jgi:hypothetical protein
MFNPATSTFAGMTAAQAQAALASINQAIINLSSGGLAASVAYTQGDGSKSVSFRATDLGKLNALKAECIAYLAHLGVIAAPRRRRAIGVVG